MGWASKLFNDKGDMLFYRGGSNGFAGAYIFTRGGDQLDIMYPEVFQAVVHADLATRFRERIEMMDDDEVVEFMLRGG